MAAELRLAPPDPYGRSEAPPLPLPDFAKRTFSVIKKGGLDPDEVQDALRLADSEIRRLRAEIASLSEELAESASRARDRVRESTAAGFLGDEAARMLASTRAAAAELEQRAAERSQHLIDDAKLRSAAILLQLEQETSKRLGELDLLEDRATEDVRAKAEQIRADADFYAESMRTSADAYATHSRRTAEADAAAILSQADQQLEEITRNARTDAAEMVREAAEIAGSQLSALDRRQSEMTERLTRERLEITRDSELVNRRRADLVDLLDRLQTFAAAGLVELTDDAVDLSRPQTPRPLTDPERLDGSSLESGGGESSAGDGSSPWRRHDN
jgi:cell division septum initiation protein DivIVA